MEVLYIIVTAQHGGAAQQPFQQLPGVRVAADHPRQFRIKTLEGRKLQQKPPHRQIEALVNMLLKICKHLPACLRRDLSAEWFSAGHTLCDGHKPQRVTGGFLQNGADLIVCYSNFMGFKELSDIVTVEEQIVCVQHGHQSRVLKGCQAAGRRSARKQHKAAFRAAADQLAKCLWPSFFLHELKIVDQQDIPVLRWR